MCTSNARNSVVWDKYVFASSIRTIAISLQVNCISYEKKFTRNVYEKNVHFNIVSGHFELMSISNYDDYQPRLIIPKLNLFFYVFQ